MTDCPDGNAAARSSSDEWSRRAWLALLVLARLAGREAGGKQNALGIGARGSAEMGGELGGVGAGAGAGAGVVRSWDGDAVGGGLIACSSEPELSLLLCGIALVSDSPAMVQSGGGTGLVAAGVLVGVARLASSASTAAKAAGSAATRTSRAPVARYAVNVPRPSNATSIERAIAAGSCTSVGEAPGRDRRDGLRSAGLDEIAFSRQPTKLRRACSVRPRMALLSTA